MIYLITKPQGKTAYYSFSRLMKEENIEEICRKGNNEIPTKKSLPATIAFRQIRIEAVEVDERV